jgi:hypothetical protein
MEIELFRWWEQSVFDFYGHNLALYALIQFLLVLIIVRQNEKLE